MGYTPSPQTRSEERRGRCRCSDAARRVAASEGLKVSTEVKLQVFKAYMAPKRVKKRHCSACSSVRPHHNGNVQTGNVEDGGCRKVGLTALNEVGQEREAGMAA